MQEAHDILPHSLDVPADDWRHGKNWRQVVATVKEEMAAEFETWMSGEEGKALNIGDEGTKLTKEQ